MEDKELYDFFKRRKQSFEEAPGDTLWSKIEEGLYEAPQAAAGKPGLSLFKKLLILPVLGIVAAIIGIVAYSPNAGEETVNPQDAGITVNASNATIIKEADTDNEYNSTDTIKKAKVPGLQPGVAAIAPAPGKLLPANTIIATDTLKFRPKAVAKPSVPIVQLQEADNTKLKLADATTLTPERVVYNGKVIAKDSLIPQTISFRADSVAKEKLPEREFEVVVLSPGASRQGIANEVLLTPADSLRSELKVIQTDTKTEPGRITITVKQSLTREQFDSFTQKVKKENNHKPGTLIIITAPGHKTFRYKVPKPVGELGP